MTIEIKELQPIICTGGFYITLIFFMKYLKEYLIVKTELKAKTDLQKASFEYQKSMANNSKNENKKLKESK